MTLHSALRAQIQTRGVKELTIHEGRDQGTDYPVALTGEQCGAQAKTHGRCYSCTRELNHRDIHIAHATDGNAVAAWDGLNQ